MQALSAYNAQTVGQAAQTTADSGIAGAKDVYLAWGKSLGIAVKELEAAWKLAQPTKATAGRGFAEHFYNWLADDSRTEEEAHDYIMSDESENTRRHLTHFLNIWALAETVRQGTKVSRTISAGKAAPKASKAQAEPKDDWEYDDSNPFADIRSAWENLKRETAKAKPRKNRLHSDKVARFNDEKLTQAYTKAFQTYCG